jgi:hypothetical protein
MRTATTSTKTLPSNTNFDNIKVGDLAESYTNSFGRVTDVWYNGITVEYSYSYVTRTYTFKEVKQGVVKIHKD